MNNTALGKLIWVLIYGGLFAVSLGVFLQEQDTTIGWTVIVLGGASAVAGAVLIAVRARRPH